MFEFNVAVLAAVTLLFLPLIVLLYSTITKSRELDRLKQVLQGVIKKVNLPILTCKHYLGYLNAYPKDKPIPPECMGCRDIMECLEHKKNTETLS